VHPVCAGNSPQTAGKVDVPHEAETLICDALRWTKALTEANRPPNCKSKIAISLLYQYEDNMRATASLNVSRGDAMVKSDGTKAGRSGMLRIRNRSQPMATHLSAVA